MAKNAFSGKKKGIMRIKICYTVYLLGLNGTVLIAKMMYQKTSTMAFHLA